MAHLLALLLAREIGRFTANEEHTRFMSSPHQDPYCSSCDSRSSKSPLHHHCPIPRFRRRAASATRSNRAPPNLHGTESEYDVSPQGERDNADCIRRGGEGDVDGVRIVAVKDVRGDKWVVYNDGWGEVDPVGPGVAPMALRCLFEEVGVYRPLARVQRAPNHRGAGHYHVNHGILWME
jgi:hypothetical protein